MFTCKKCNKSFEDSHAVGGHAVYCGKDLSVPCVICHRMINKFQLTRHVEAHKKDKPCLFCGKTVFDKGRNRRKFCSHSCAAKKNNPENARTSLNTCIQCGHMIKRRGKFCSIACHKLNTYETYIKKWLAGEVSGNTGDCMTLHVRKWSLDRAGQACEGILEDGTRCNWNSVNLFTGKVPLTVHHIDGKYKNTRPDNLVVLCPNCHSLTKTYGGRNRGNGHPFRKAWRKRKALMA